MKHLKACCITFATLLLSLPILGSPTIITLPDNQTAQIKDLRKYTPESKIGNPLRSITPTEAQALYPYALASRLAHTPRFKTFIQERLAFLGLKTATYNDIPEQALKYFDTDTGYLSHWPSGLQARLFLHEKSKTAILAFAGTDFSFSSRSPITMSAAAQIAVGSQAWILEKGRRLCILIKDSPKVNQIIVTGISLGGAVAQFTGIACDAPAIAFNSLALDKSLQLRALRPAPSIEVPEELAEKTLITHTRQLIIAHIEDESLNNPDSPINWALQNEHPQGLTILTIPPENKKLNSRGRHWASPLMKAMEKHAGYTEKNLQKCQSQKHGSALSTHNNHIIPVNQLWLAGKAQNCSHLTARQTQNLTHISRGVVHQTTGNLSTLAIHAGHHLPTLKYAINTAHPQQEAGWSPTVAALEQPRHPV